MRRIILAAIFVLCACSSVSKHEILEKAEGVTTLADLESALGAPDERDKLGPVETWTYNASDGKVTFLVTGETVVLQTTLDLGD